MKILDRYTIFLFLGPFFLTFFIVLFVFVMQFLWLYIDDIIGKGLSLVHIVQLLVFMSSSFVPMSLPLAVLLSSIMIFGGISERYELTSIKVAGVSLIRCMLSLCILILFISIFSFYFSNKIVPYSNFKALNLLSNIRTQKPSMNIKEGIFDNSIDDISIKVGKKENDNLYNIIIYQTSKKKIITTVAKKGIMSKDPKYAFMTFELFDGYTYENNLDNTRENRYQSQYSTYFKEQTIHFDLSSFNLSKINEDKRKNEKSMLNIKQINIEIEKSKVYLNNFLDRESISVFNRITNKDGIIKENIEKGDSNKNNVTNNISLLKYLDSCFLKMENKNFIINNIVYRSNNFKTYISSQERSIKSYNENINSYIMEIHRKYTFAFACIIMFFIGAPLGSVIRKGGLGLPIVISVLIFIVYQVLFMSSEKMGYSASIDPLFARWIAAIFLTPFAIWLTYKSNTDSPLLDLNKYLKPYYFIIDYIKKRKGKTIFYERKIK